MSKAEDLAEKLYPKKEHVAFGPLPCEEPSVFDDNKPYRIGFVKGYHQAEKDLELTWEDISKIISIDQQVCGVMGIANYTYNHQQAMEEVLKRFKERKEK